MSASWLLATVVCGTMAGMCAVTGAVGLVMTRASHDAMGTMGPTSDDDLGLASILTTSASVGALAIAFALVVAATTMAGVAWLNRDVGGVAPEASRARDPRPHR